MFSLCMQQSLCNGSGTVNTFFNKWTALLKALLLNVYMVRCYC